MAGVGFNYGSSRQSSGPWSKQQPYFRDLWSRAKEQSFDPREYFDQSTVVPFASETERGLSGITQRAKYGSDLVPAAQRMTQATLEGQRLHPESNPYLRATYEAASRPVVRSLQTAAIPHAELSRYGRGGSGAEVNRLDRAYDASGRALTDLSTSIYGGNYGRERAFQEQAGARSIPLSEYDYADSTRLLGVGQAREQLASRYLQDMIDRFTFEQEEPRQRLVEYANLIGQPVMTSRGRSKNFGGQMSYGTVG